MTYDDAVFHQRIKSLANGSASISVDQFLTGFWAAAWDIRLSVEQQKPELFPYIDDMFLLDMGKDVAEYVRQKMGLTVVGLKERIDGYYGRLSALLPADPNEVDMAKCREALMEGLPFFSFLSESCVRRLTAQLCIMRFMEGGLEPIEAIEAVLADHSLPSKEG